MPRPTFKTNQTKHPTPTTNHQTPNNVARFRLGLPLIEVSMESDHDSERKIFLLAYSYSLMDSELRRRGGKGERKSEATECTGAGSHEAEQGLQATSDFQPKWELRISEGSTGTVKLVAGR
jgi:hypothetical protein